MSTLYVDNLQPNLGSQVEIDDLKPLAGSVVSVNRISMETSQVTTSQNFIDVTDGSLTVTPKTSNSTFIVTASCHGYTSTAGTSSWSSLVIRLVRDTVDLGGYLVSNPYFDAILNPNSSQAMHQPLIKRTDTPSTTSPITYKVQAFSKFGRTCQINHFSYGFLEVIEVAG